jgi:DNA polymerase-1
MLDAFKAGGDFHSRTAMNMYQHIRDAVDEKKVILEWHPQPGQEKPPVPLLKVLPSATRFFFLQLWRFLEVMLAMS